MEIRLNTEDFIIPRPIFDEAVEMCNRILASPEQLSEVFLGLAREFCDDAEAAAGITVARLSDVLMQPGRVVTLFREDDAEEDFTMISIPADDLIFVNVQDLPDQEKLSRYPEREPKYLIFLLMALLHECSHLFTKSLNILANNTNNTEEETPEKIGRATINNETEKDAGAGLEISLFGGIMFFDKGTLTVTVVSDPNLSIDATNASIYEVSNEIAESVAQELRSWYMSGNPSSVYHILKSLHHSRLLPFVNPVNTELLDRIRSKFHGHVYKALKDEAAEAAGSIEHLLRGLIRKKLQPTKIPGGKK